jgi:GMP synthase-like glutamine amidotransferase
LLECDHVPEKFRHIAGDYREMFATLLAQHAPQLELVNYDVCNGELPATIDACEAFITTGSKFSAYDDVDWIHALKGFIRQLHEANKPFVGICFGHQLLAEALGGKVAKAETGWGVGAHAVKIIHRESWMTPDAANCRLQYMHQDQVQRMPDNSVLLGNSAHCPVAMYRVGATMLGIQAHPEFPAAYSEALMLDRIPRIGEARVRDGVTSLVQATDEAIVTNWIVQFMVTSLAQ